MGNSRRFNTDLNFNPASLGDTTKLRTHLLGSIAAGNPSLDADAYMRLVEQTVTSLSYLAGAEADGFVSGIDAVVRADEYRLRVVM